MKSVTLRDDPSGRNLAVQEVPRPEPGPNEVRLKVVSAGVCGSDVGAWQSKPAYDFLDTPRILGHEYVGVVDTTGDDVDAFERGDRVVERPLHACGTCTACRHGDGHVCENVEITGFHRDGAFAEYIVAPTGSLHPVPESLPNDIAAVTEPMAVAARATLERSSFTPGDDVFVLGAGPMGAFSALIAEYSGGNVVIGGLSNDEPRFETISGLGIETANLEVNSVEAVAEEATDGWFDIIIDATGSTAALEENIHILRPGGDAVVIGIPTGTLGVPSPSFVRGERRVSGSYGATINDFERAIAILVNVQSEMTELLRSYDVSDADTAFQNFLDGEVIKPIINVSDI